ncbi:acyl-CoA dehydrogenase [Rhodococcus hoagii]|uniref:Acyl-CoA dehydrogenase n=1 Tax=Rhodococcus hoagii TaxID=43767 RepID=A0AAE4ZJ65_RHOHA|nr:acyl-CoA dehydrogenase family protein [Prescottella equi]MCD7051443.1 acyl-CoA/acyl-ACP dehydrogenase [Rhodococcus sp. BH2-1]GBF14605.1 acyl-CoA dehydrogenase [Rhodococcus sp. Br-6]MBM4477751.1 acyl-CoA dehydrogenase [Prescottella equi]MBM4522311.1 acyl-CoA dehydrogenase [Prescottella equi]MBM4524720.1 acyl-CoA dehydrogenase [Prescottella equi]
MSGVGVFAEEQIELRKTVAQLLAKRADAAALRKTLESGEAFDRGLWDVLCQQVGVAALAIPEEFGGFGATLVEQHLVLEELGAALTPSPMFGSAVLAAQAILATGNDEACERLLPGIAEGSSIAALCWVGPEGHWRSDDVACTAAGSDADGYTVSGTAHYVLDGAHADVLIVAAAVEGSDGVIGLFEVDPAAGGVARRQLPTMDLTRPMSLVEFDSAPAVRLTADDATAALEKVRTIAIVALSAEQVGAAERCMQMTVDYSKDRVQFGRAIGSFQALKHRMADLYFLVETARSASYAAVHSLSEGLPTAAADALVAKAYCSEAFLAVTGDAIQLHGGIAITWEHDAHLFFKRAHGSAQLLGQPEEFFKEMETLAGLPA